MLNVLDQSLKFKHFQFFHLLKYLYSQPFQCVKISVYENFRKVFQTEFCSKYEKKTNSCHLTNHNYSMYNTFKIKGFKIFQHIYFFPQESPEDPRLVPLNLFICLVSRYFDQTDLADPGT